MSAMALLGAFSGGQGGQKLGGDAGPSAAGPATSGGGYTGGLSFNTGNAAPDYTTPALILGALGLAYLVFRRRR